MRSPPQARMGERQARFEAVYAAYRTPVLGYALRRTLSPDDAADILAETFLVAWRKLDQIPSGPDARLWLFGVARNALANHYRGERRRTALAARLGTELAQFYIPPEYDGESAAIAAALRRLPEDQREVLTLSAWEGLDYGQIANVLTGYGNYPSLNATWFYALADVPGVSLRHVTDAAGRQDIAFTFPSQDGVTAILINERLLNAGTVQYEGYVRDSQQTLVLNQTPVSGPGVRP